MAGEAASHGRTDVVGMSEQFFNRLMIAGLAAGFLAITLMVAASVWLLGQSAQFSYWVEHTYQAEAQISQLTILTERLETARRGYLLTPDPIFLKVYTDARLETPRALDNLTRTVRDNPKQMKRVALLRELLADRIGAADATMSIARAGARDRALALFNRTRQSELMVTVRGVLDAMLREEQALMARRTLAQRSNGAQLLVAVLGVAGLLLVLGGAAFFVIRRYAGDLSRSQGELAGINAGLEDRVRERTADLTRANDEIQRFAYIVSHDLRSPLVNVMGFTSELEITLKPLQAFVAGVEARAPELVTPEAREAVETDLPESIRFIRSATRKMDRLINAILKLSREGRRTIIPEPLAMNALLEAQIDSVSHQLSERGATATIEGRLPDIVSDRLGIEQVFGNLIDNAVKYLSPGRPGRITICGRAEPSRVVFEVTDNGRGIDPRDHERIFELFRRAGPQTQQGEGIGLAHVRALVHRLGGVITCTSALDQGATFRVSLPRIIYRDEGPSL